MTSAFPMPSPSPDQARELLASLAAKLDRADIEAIAKADYGHEWERHASEVVKIVKSGDAQPHLPWHPGEVFQLTRWSDEDQATSPVDHERVHRQRAFSCAALLVSTLGSSEAGLGFKGTIIQLIGSLAALGRPMDRQAFDLFVGLAHSCVKDDPEELIFVGLGALYFALAIPKFGDAKLEALLAWLFALEQEITDEYKDYGQWARVGWMAAVGGGRTGDKWEDFVRLLKDRLTKRHTAAVREGVELVALVFES